MIGRRGKKKLGGASAGDDGAAAKAPHLSKSQE